MLQADRFQKFLILGIALVAVYFTAQLVKEFFSYFPLKSKASASILQWEVEEIEGQFSLKATYSFEAKEKNWKNSFRLSKPYYWNEPAAISALKRLAKDDWSAWYSPKDPSSSALEKNFPSGLLFRTVICYALLIYFLLLKININ